jgi:hypothetical protein
MVTQQLNKRKTILSVLVYLHATRTALRPVTRPAQIHVNITDT